MSKNTDLIGSVVRILVAIPKEYLGLMLDIANKLGGAEGAAWYATLKVVLKTSTTTALELSAEMLNSSDHTRMQDFYDKHFPEMEVIVPHFEDKKGWVGLYIAQGLTCDAVYAAWNFRKWKWASSIDAELDPAREARSATNGPYLVYVRDGAEPDTEYLGKSVHQADPNGTLGTTLLERMVHEKIHFDRTGKHLDIKGATFCSGSRYRDGFVPDVYLNSNHEVVVSRYGVGNSFATCGVREAVLDSLPS